MSKVIVSFCEGDHDIAMLSKILSVYGYSPYRKKVKDFPMPLNELYINILSGNTIEDREFKFQRANKDVPFVVLSKDDVLVIFHNLGGDGNIINGEATSIINKYVELNDLPLRKVSKYDEIDFRFLFFLDADDAGVEKRLEEVKNILELDHIEHHKIYLKSSFEIGCYIFHDKYNEFKHGKLENLLLDLMKPNNDNIFKESIDFINNNRLETNRQKEYICGYESDGKYRGSVQFKKDKSVISVAGQLQFSGANNSVIITKSDYIKTDDIKDNECCNDIMEIFAR